MCRKLSCEACYNISDAGLQCLTACTHLSDLTISYCNQVGTHVVNWFTCLKKRTWPFYTCICYCRWRMLVWCVWLAWESWRRLLQELAQGYLTEVFKEVCTLCSMWHTLPIALWHFGFEMALRKNWHYACICGYHMLPKFTTVAVLCWKSSIGICGCP